VLNGTGRILVPIEAVGAGLSVVISCVWGPSECQLNFKQGCPINIDIPTIDALRLLA
jgi:hypothetical protein